MPNRAPCISVYHSKCLSRPESHAVSRSDVFDVSKVHDVYDCAKYDFIHNRHLGLQEVYTSSPLHVVL